MKRLFLLSTISFISACAAYAQTDIKVLDLTKASTVLTFDTENGAWTGTYDDDAESIESQCFSFVHSSINSYKTWWGFTASNSANNDRQSNTITFQFSNMAKGGIVLKEDGTVMTDAFGTPVISDSIPYLVAYYSPFMAKRPVQLAFNDGKSYQAVGVYVNLNSYSYYSIECGDSFSRAFTQGDKFTLTIHGVASDESEKAIDVELASYDNGNLTINRGWKYVDLSPLGVVNEMYFTMKSTDTGTYGDNTPEYFCLDKLMVKPSSSTGVDAVASNSPQINYDRNTNIVTITGAEFTAVYDTLGNKVMTSEERSFDISSLPAGVYIIRTDNKSLKIAK